MQSWPLHPGLYLASFPGAGPRVTKITDGIAKIFGHLAVDIVPKLYFCVLEPVFDKWVAEQTMAYQNGCVMTIRMMM